jgi:hypothetical protein
MKHVLLVMLVVLYTVVWGQLWTALAAGLMLRAIYDDWRRLETAHAAT